MEPPTFASIGFQVLHGGDDNRNASVTLRYRIFGSATWRNAQSLIRVPVERVDWKALPRQFAGSLFDLRPGIAYEYELNIADPDGFAQTIFGIANTRPLPAPAANPRTVSATSVASLQAAVAGAQPGDVITLKAGVYSIPSLIVANSGTASNPITIRGASADKTILDGQNCDCNVIEVWGSYIRIESMTLRNAFQGLRYFGASTGNQFTRNIVANVEKGINSQAGQTSFLIADNQFSGRVAFAPPYSELPDSYAIQILGSHHILAHNQITGFFDGIRLFGGGNRNVDIYGNDFVFVADDGIELDDSDGNNRVQRNRISNSSTGVSTQPVAGGPAYILRNIVINPNTEQIKFHANSGPPPRSPSGVYVYQNTFVSPNRALTMGAALPGYDSHFRNNIFTGTVGGSAVGWDGPMYGLSFNYDGYHPGGRAYWNWQGAYVDYPNVAAMVAGGVVESQGLALSDNVFLGGLTAPPGFNLYVPPQLPLLSPGGNGVNAGLTMSNINDYFTGAGADLGALESGCPPPLFGPRPAGVDDSNQVRGCQETPVPANTNPANLGVLPIRGVGAQRVFTASASDPNGAADLESITLLVGPSSTIAQGCAVVLKRVTESIYLYNDGGTALLGPIKPGSAQTLANSRCTVNGASSLVEYVSSQNTVRFSADVAFASTFRTLKNVYLNSLDLNGASGGWTLSGTWR
ncbi:MAG: right-handed parallel beta-helix repeat-containing protein [Bryobacteraceae bacterium]